MRTTSVLTSVMAAALLIAAPTAVSAQTKTGGNPNCVEKGGRGTGSTVDDARFQAWEAVLQATSWPMWAAWMTSGAKVGHAAAGYRVSSVRQRCGNGGALGKECIMRAKLCQTT